MMTLEAIRQKLQDRRISKVSKSTGLHYNTIREVRDNPDANPKISTMKALEAYFEGRS